MHQRRQQRCLRGAVGKKSQSRVQHAAIEFDLERQAAVRIVDGHRRLLRSELLAQVIQILPQLRVGGRAVGRCLAARHDQIQRALAVERRLGADGLLQGRSPRPK